MFLSMIYTTLSILFSSLHTGEVYWMRSHLNTLLYIGLQLVLDILQFTVHQMGEIVTKEYNPFDWCAPLEDISPPGPVGHRSSRLVR